MDKFDYTAHYQASMVNKDEATPKGVSSFFPWKVRFGPATRPASVVDKQSSIANLIHMDLFMSFVARLIAFDGS